MKILELTSIHGFNYTTDSDRPFCVRIFWAIIILAGMISTICIVQSAFENWNEHPILTTIDSASLSIKEVQFPTVTVCSDLRVDRWGPIKDILNSKTRSVYTYNKPIELKLKEQEKISEWKNRFSFINLGLFDYLSENLGNIPINDETDTLIHLLHCICSNKFINDSKGIEQMRTNVRENFLQQEIFLNYLKLEEITFESYCAYNSNSNAHHDITGEFEIRNMCTTLLLTSFVNVLYLNSERRFVTYLGDHVANLAPYTVGRSVADFAQPDIDHIDDHIGIESLFNFSSDELELHKIFQSMLDEIFQEENMNMSLLEIPSIFEENKFAPLLTHIGDDNTLKYPFSLSNYNKTASIHHAWPHNFFGRILTPMKKEVTKILLSSVIGYAEDITPLLDKDSHSRYISLNGNHPRDMLKVEYKSQKCITGKKYVI